MVMQNTITPIETIYKGYKFRSRLEARWAVFFDFIGANWEYEPEGYEMPGGQRYLPDFLLRDVKGRFNGDLYIEVKGKLDNDNLRKIETFAGRYCPKSNAQFACTTCPLTFRCEYKTAKETPILIVGNIPDPDNYWQFICDNYACGTDNPENRYLFNLYLIDGDWFPAIPCMDKNGGLHLDDGNHNFFKDVDEDLTIEAYKRARGTRFE